jgi:hypothetical protein
VVVVAVVGVVGGGRGVMSNCSTCGVSAVVVEEEIEIQSWDTPGTAQSDEKVLLVGEFNDTIATEDGLMSQRRVRVSDSAGSFGSVKSAEDVRNGHEAMRVEGDDVVVVIVVPDGIWGGSGDKRGIEQPSRLERHELGGGVDVDEGVWDEVGDWVGDCFIEELGVDVGLVVKVAVLLDELPDELVMDVVNIIDAIGDGVVDEVSDIPWVAISEKVGDCDAVGDGVGKMHEVIKIAPSNPLR